MSEKIINRHILEIRHTPYMKFLDNKGNIANSILKLSNFNFKYWSLKNDRIDLMDGSEKIKIFTSLTNYGMVIEDSPSPNYFKDQAIIFIKNLFEIEGFSERDIKRIGTRSFFLVDRNIKFNIIKSRYQEKYLNLNPNMNEIFDADIDDIGAPFIFSEKNNKKNGFNTMSGPMVKEQMKKYFPQSNIYSDETLPNTALYFDIDYFTKDIGKINKDDLLKIVKKNINRATDIFTKYKDYVLE